MTAALAPWLRPDPDLTDYHPRVAYPAPKRPDAGGPARAPAVSVSRAAGAPCVDYVPVPPAATTMPAPAPASSWAPADPGPAVARSAAVPAGPVTVTWCRPPRRLCAESAYSGRHQAPASPCYGGPDEINYDPPEYSMGTGLIQSQPDGSIVVHPLSVVEPGCEVGDEGPINESLLVSPVVYLAAGRPYALASQVVIPNGATLYCNRAAIDRDMFVLGEGATVYD